MNPFGLLLRLDAYPKAVEDNRVKTYGGAAVTIISVLIMVWLFISELQTYIYPSISEELFVDTTRNHKLKINLDFYIPTISCDYLSLDAMDSTGDQHLHIEHNIFKRKLDLQGNAVEAPKKEEIVTSTTKKVKNETTAEAGEEKSKSHEPPKCGDCYGAQMNDTHCCNSCQDVIDAYREKRWQPNPDDFEQCKGQKQLDKQAQSTALKEGCQIYGNMEVNRMGGSFHIAPGKSFSINHIHVHDVQPYSSMAFNTSHRIDHLSFGERVDFAKTHPLDGLAVSAEEGGMMFQYYIKIVPTMVVNRYGATLYTNQFSVTRHQKKLSIASGETGMPGVFFSYELSPLMVKYTEHEGSLGHFATNVCAIIGGIYTVAGLLVSFLNNYVIRRKIEIGKFS